MLTGSLLSLPHSQEACQNYNCVDPCTTTCGSGAECDVRRHVAICRCPRGFTGDPFQVSINQQSCLWNVNVRLLLLISD